MNLAEQEIKEINEQEEKHINITVDEKRFKKYDENTRHKKKVYAEVASVELLLILAAVGCFFFNIVAGIIVGIIAVLGLIFTIYFVTGNSNVEELYKNVYYDPILIPAVIVNLKPLTIIAIADITFNSNITRYACLKKVLKKLPDTNLSINQIIPCACAFGNDDGDYWHSYEPFPLCWATKNTLEIDEAMRYLEQCKPCNPNQFEVIKRINEEYPNLKPWHMVILDENYNPMGEKELCDENFPMLHLEPNYTYKKNYSEIKYINDNIPAKEIYNYMIDEAVKLHVYEYISSGGQQDGNPDITQNTGLLTYAGDSAALLEAAANRKIALQSDEYPLFGGHFMVTTKGCWNNKKFIPWHEANIKVNMKEDRFIEILINNKLSAFFDIKREFFTDKDKYNDCDWKDILISEQQNIEIYFNNIKKKCICSNNNL